MRDLKITKLESWNTYYETTSYNETGDLTKISPFSETGDLDDIPYDALAIEDLLDGSAKGLIPLEIITCLEVLKKHGLDREWLLCFVCGFNIHPDYLLLRRTHILLRNAGLKNNAISKCMECLIVLHFKARDGEVPTDLIDDNKSVLYNVCLYYLCGEISQSDDYTVDFHIGDTKELDLGGIEDIETLNNFKNIYDFNSFDDMKTIDRLLEAGYLGNTYDGYSWNLIIDFILSLDDPKHNPDSHSLRSDLMNAFEGEKTSSQKIANLVIHLWGKGIGTIYSSSFILNLTLFLEDQDQQLHAGNIIVDLSDLELKRSKKVKELDRHSDAGSYERWHYKSNLTSGITLLVRSAMQGNDNARAKLQSLSKNNQHKELILEIGNHHFSEQIGI